MGSFDAQDIFRIAVRIEENGGAFYRYAAQIAETADAKELFTFLAEEEKRHENLFSSLFEQNETWNVPEEYPGEYVAYLNDFVDGSIVFSKEAMRKKLADINNTVSALDFAIAREMDSILYYHELRELLPKHQQRQITGIIEEERRHVAMLSGMKNRFKGKETRS